jgi:uncharacterized repeat protein (TIGR01451 family)
MAGAALLGLVSQSALALGTASGTVVDNLAKLSYSVGGTAQNEICSSTTGNTTGNGGTTGTTCVSGTNGATATSFTVDNKTNLTVAEGNTTFTSVVPGQTTAVTTFTVTNNGNTVQDVLLAGANVAAAQTLFTLTDNFQMSNVLVFVDSNNNGTYDAGTDTATFIDELAANGSKTVFIVADVPSTQINNDAALVSLTATVAAGGAAATQGAAVAETTGADTAGVDIVFADAAGSDEVARDGKHSARDAYKVVSAVISVQKTSALLCDPFNGSTNPKNIPGAAVQYAITITNTGTAAATLSQVTDTLNAALAFNTDLISGTGAGANCVTGTGSLSASGFGAVSGTGATTYAAPGLAAQAVTAGASVAGQLVTINYGTLASPATGSLVGGVLPAGDFVTVYFNAFVQ